MPNFQVSSGRHALPFPARTTGPIIGLVALLLTLVAPLARGQDPSAGQEDLDNATVAKLSAQSLADLESVTELCESALAKGLDETNQQYARDLLKSTLYEQAERLSRLIFDQQPVDPRWPRIRQVCYEKLQRALEVDPEIGNVHLLIARLQTLPGGDRDAARKAIEKAIPALAEEPELLSVAYQTRAALTDDREQSLQDLNKAIELYPRNLAAWRARGVYYLAGEEYDKALKDLEELLTRDPDDQMAHQAIAQTLRQLKQFDKAMEHLNQVIEANPDSSLAYNLRARIEEERGNLPAALENLNEAVRVAPQDIGALLYRARLLAGQQQYDVAREDVNRALQLRPQLPQAILLRSVIAAAQGRYGEAIGDLQLLLRMQPDNVEIKIQIATFYEADRRPRKAVELYTEILESQPDNWRAHRHRGDAYLSIAKQAEALHDYEAAVAIDANEPGLLNNLAWVLATSPHDDLRDGKRALEFAKKACELTQYEAAHILSTLAASYAEMGDFEKAIEWSEKAVAMDNEEHQLSKELESYRAGKAWREEQQVEENTVELKIPEETASPGVLDVFDDLPDLDPGLDPDTPDAEGTPDAAPPTPTGEDAIPQPEGAAGDGS